MICRRNGEGCIDSLDEVMSFFVLLAKDVAETVIGAKRLLRYSRYKIFCYDYRRLTSYYSQEELVSKVGISLSLLRGTI